jgi:hypothetical protein
VNDSNGTQVEQRHSKWGHFQLPVHADWRTRDRYLIRSKTSVPRDLAELAVCRQNTIGSIEGELRSHEKKYQRELAVGACGAHHHPASLGNPSRLTPETR